MRRKLILAVAFLGLIGRAAPATAQQPRLGFGVGGGIVLGSQLLNHTFPVTIGDDELQLAQQVYLNEVGVVGAQLELYLIHHLALRLHLATGRGMLEATTLPDNGQRVDVGPFQTGFGNVRFTALDAGLSLWPWAPRSESFTPFLTLGSGTVRYHLQGVQEPEAFFRGLGPRPRRALVIGAGADMNVWSPLMLRFEVMNHLTDSPLLHTDFRQLGTGSDPLRSGASTVSNVRLVIGAHVYYPFSTGEPTP